MHSVEHISILNLFRTVLEDADFRPSTDTSARVMPAKHVALEINALTSTATTTTPGTTMAFSVI